MIIPRSGTTLSVQRLYIRAVMLSRRIFTIGIAVVLLCEGTIVNCRTGNAPHSAGPGLSIGLSFSARERFPLKNLKLSIVAPDGNTTWHYAAEGDKEVDVLMKQPVVPAEGWYSDPGKYSLAVSYSLEGPADKVREEKQEFLATGEELRIMANLWFIDDQEKHQAFLADLTITRCLKGTNNVWLIQDWIPAAQTQPRYQVVNSTNQQIYGVVWDSNFFGRIQSEVNGQWQPYIRGGFCGTVGGGQPIEPHQSVGSIEGHFIGRVRPFVTGRYRYVVQYSLNSTFDGVPTELIEKGLGRKRAQEIYEVSMEFQIESPDK